MILKIQAVDLGRRIAWPPNPQMRISQLSIEATHEVSRLVLLMATTQNSPCGSVVKQHSGKERGYESFQILAIHT